MKKKLETFAKSVNLKEEYEHSKKLTADLELELKHIEDKTAHTKILLGQVIIIIQTIS